LLLLVGLAYFVLAGATSYGEVIVPVQVLNFVVLTPIVVAYVVGVGQADRIDKAVLISLLLFVASALFSAFPRQSVDAVLGALAFAAALFVARGLLSRAELRSALVVLMMGLSLVVSIAMAMSWLPLVIEWWSLVDWNVAPPLNLELSGLRWGHRHDAALLIAMLYPAWWIGRQSLARRAFAIGVGLLDLTLIIVDGSRTLWLALLLATVIVGVPAARRKLPEMRASATAWIAVTVAAIGFAVLAGAFADRLSNLFSLDYRFAIWSALFQSWTEHPITGLGPGSFPWILQTTGYFDSNSLAPRHPDNAVMQQLGETGLIGLVAMAVLLAAIVPAMLRSRSPGPTWALAAFIFASVGSNPTSFGFIIAVAIAWVAYAVPRDPPREVANPRRWPPVRVASLAGVAGIGVFLAASVVASTSHALAISAISDRRYGDAGESLSRAIEFDPSMPLYWRERGITRIFTGQSDDAIEDLERASTLNPSDDLALRALAVAEANVGNVERARSLANQAASVQRSDPTNLLLMASLAIAADDEVSSMDGLAQAVHGWPSITATPEWGEFISGSSLSTESVVNDAVEDADAGEETPRGDSLLLTALSGATEPPRPNSPDPVSNALFESYLCGEGVQDFVDTASDSARRLPAFWVVVARETARRGDVDERAIRLLEIFHRIEIDPESAAVPLRVIDQYDFPSLAGVDYWGYRRLITQWPDDVPGWPALPSPTAGETTWLLNPTDARMNSGLPACGGQ
jgi:O-antigen ligase